MVAVLLLSQRPFMVTKPGAVSSHRAGQLAEPVALAFFTKIRLHRLWDHVGFGVFPVGCARSVGWQNTLSLFLSFAVSL